VKPVDILGSQGAIARRLPQYEERPQQLQMADAVAEAIRAKKHLLVEAGTGVGKSFGYLVPAILSLAENQAMKDSGKRRIVVSTHTISLQEQLMGNDLPLLNSLIPLEFSAVLGKGRSNYLSLRRLGMSIEKANSLFSSAEEHDQLEKVRIWSQNTTDGSLAEMARKPMASVWDEVRSDTSNCLGRKCPTFKDCFYFAARQRLQNADILVVNHALFFTDLALRKKGVNLLPDYHTVILDEAHTVPDVAGDHLGIALTMGQIEYSLNKLYNEHKNKGLLVHHGSQDGQRAVVRCHQMTEDFFQDILGWVAHNNPSTVRSLTTRVRKKGIVANLLSPALLEVSRLVDQLIENLDDPSEKMNLSSASDRLVAMATELESWRLQELQDAVYWIESSLNRFHRQQVSLNAAPIEVGPILRETLFSKTDCCILASATLATGRGSFEFFQNRIGLTQAETLMLGSPFDYRRQAKLIVVTNMADPSQPAQRDTHERQSIEAIKKYVERTDGRAFVLCTSYQFLNRAVRELTPWMTEKQLKIYTQGDGSSRTALLESFKQQPRGVLFGTDSFWQGVDVQGEALQNVIIPKLPFSVPDHPLLEARLDAIRKSGGNPFMDYQVPEAVIKFKQGFGRLIRSKTDTGIVVILDPRIRTKLYGKTFLNSLPNCEVIFETL
jgi:ATP-dependent DNA helicase DinG